MRSSYLRDQLINGDPVELYNMLVTAEHNLNREYAVTEAVKQSHFDRIEQVNGEMAATRKYIKELQAMIDAERLDRDADAFNAMKIINAKDVQLLELKDKLSEVCVSYEEQISRLRTNAIKLKEQQWDFEYNASCIISTREDRIKELERENALLTGALEFEQQRADGLAEEMCMSGIDD